MLFSIGKFCRAHGIITQINYEKDLMMMEYRREIAVIYTLEDALHKLNEMKQHGFFEHEVHIFTKSVKPLHSLKMNTDIQVHQAGNLVDQMLSFTLRMKLYEVCLRPYHFSENERTHYAEVIQKGAILIIAEHEYPLEKHHDRAFKPIPNVTNNK